MGKAKNKAYDEQQQARTDIRKTAATDYQTNKTPSPLEGEMAGVSQGMAGNYNKAVTGDADTYKGIMSGYGDYAKNANFSYKPVTAQRPAELSEGYGYLREAMPGYRDFAKTGGYSDTDIQELRARGTSPIRAAYGNTMMEMDRARSLGGNNGSPNYIAAVSRAQRDMPGQMADAMTGVNAELANSVRQGKLSGLAGMSGIGSTMGGMAGDEAGRILQADVNNQQADLQTQGMKDRANQFGLSGQAGLYGTTPGQSAMFGNQALQAYNTRAGMEQSRNQFGLGLMDAQMRSFNPQNDAKPKPWWQTALQTGAQMGGQVLGAMAGAPGGRI